MILKILVGAPTFKRMEYCEKEFLQRIKELTYLNYDILIIDNSKEKDYSEKLRKIDGINVIHDETNLEKSIFRLISSRIKILDYGVKGGYDYILMLDSDVIPPKNIIEELLKWKKDIVSGVYFNYFNISGQIKLLPVVRKFFTEEQFEELKRISPKFSNKERESISRYLTEEEMKCDELQKVEIPAAGCMLISRKVFETVRYGKLSGGADDDIYFIKCAKEKGFDSYCYPKILCEHLIKEKYKQDEKGNLIHSSFSDIVGFKTR